LKGNSPPYPGKRINGAFIVDLTPNPQTFDHLPVKLPPAKPVAYRVSASKAPLNHAPPKAAELYCGRSFSLIKNLLHARNPFFSSPFNTQGHKGGGWEGDGLLVGWEKTPSPVCPPRVQNVIAPVRRRKGPPDLFLNPPRPLEREGIHHRQLLPHYRRRGQTSLRPPAQPEAYLSEVKNHPPRNSAQGRPLSHICDNRPGKGSECPPGYSHPRCSR
jgi:hypothetical protein